MHKYKHVYAPALDGKVAAELCSCEIFLRHYQMMRNIWALDPASVDTLVFLVPRANERLKDEITLIYRCISEQYRNRVSVSYLEDVIDEIESAIPVGEIRLVEHFKQFRQKYIPKTGETG